ncbi:N-acetylmuramoyl-L-alanine amidase [Pseudohalocynthiibacter aestuariivivens]|uniref:N-acetylmuramoyl-L-alanine amidase n=1 Tax=Pseudohalocynthiibacter aestuariivivens TaxID=1591409 RepID=A0ABV5JB97_9RHOB|nr:N-acetylmuramoyl-L-alanine amidase [Pseudohalocynthiibacter aestuariivivens]MBS9715708.1 N-acetylmuramoyl-L-alanine amidase [Pseudohalocynthiibacter aestuariivivens]
MRLRQVSSPNFGERRGGAKPDMVVIHYTAMESADAACARLCDPQYEVSAHYLIDEFGEVSQLVAEEMRAWHAGSGSWGAVSDVNSRSIGIELANSGFAPFSEGQMQSLENVLTGVMARWSIPPERIIGHSDMSPERKNDPGRRFDWRRFARLGLSVWPDEEECNSPSESAFVSALQGFGYPDVEFGPLCTAFRMRFRPWVTGALTAEDVGAALNLARRFPVDRAPQTT